VAPDETLACAPAQRPAAAWPLMSHLELQASPAAVPRARRHATAVANEWELAALAADLELIVSELTTNALHTLANSYGNGLTAAVVRLSLVSDLQCVLICVEDGSHQMPVYQSAAPNEESGRGLMLVDALCSDWGAYRTDNGKVVWAVIYT
jgi:anti-sigma regulatory factor (Ser/Thr protein kinase)